MDNAKHIFSATKAVLFAVLLAFSPSFAEPDYSVATDETAQLAVPLALDASTLSKAFDTAGVMSYRCRLALKDFEKAVADANATAEAQRAKVAEVARKYLKDSLEKVRADGDLDQVIVFQKALETLDGEIVGDAKEIVKLRNGRAAQLVKIDKNLVASGLVAANAFIATLEWQKKEMTQKGETEKALKVAAFQKRIEEWAKRTRDSGERISPRAATEVPRPVAQPRQPPLVTQAKEPEAKIYTINSRSHKGTSIGKINAGDTIEIQYVSGLWAQRHDREVKSPDIDGNACLLVRHDDPAHRILIVPRMTKEEPCRYVYDDETCELALRIDDGNARTGQGYDDNVGSVRYSVKIIPDGVRPHAVATGGSRPPVEGGASMQPLHPVTPATGKPSVRVTNHTLTGTQAEESLTLSKTVQPHVVKGQYFVPEDKELTIEAGATIIFEKGASLYCQGNLMMRGSDDAQIVLKGKTSAMDYWEGVYVNGVGTTIEWASISGAKSAVKINAQKASVRNCVLTRNTRGIEVTPSGRGAEFDNCLFISNAEDGLQIHEAVNVVINGCSFIKNGKWGLLSGKSGVVVTSCLFQGNTAGGYSLRLERGGVQVSGCVFANNGAVDINAENTENNHLNFRQNYWGAAVTRQLQRDGVGANLRNINDGHDSGSGNIVDVSEFLTEPPKECGSTLKW